MNELNLSTFSNTKNDRKNPRPKEVAALMAAGKVPPNALEVEMAVLGALMLEKDALPRVIDILNPEVFYRPIHRTIYEAIHALFLASEAIDSLTVVNQLRKMGKLDEVGGIPYIAELTARVASAANIEAHSHIVVQKYMAREVIRISSDLAADGYEETTDIFELLDKAEKNFYELSGNNLRRESQSMELLTLKTIQRLEELRNKGEGITGVTTGFTALDDMTAGWQPSDLIIIAARPSMGKTAFVLALTRNAAVKANTGVVVFSLEMAATQLVQRLLCAEAELDQSRVRTGKLEDYEWIQLNQRVGELSKAPIYIDDTPALSIYDLRAKCRRLKAEKNIGLIIIDYLQLMSANTGSKGMGNREQEIALISRTLKQLAKELNVPVIALSQLSRAVETRGGDKRPMLSDLRESGSIEQDADVVMFLYRPEYYGLQTDEDGNSTIGVCEVIVGKQRNGPVDTVRLHFINKFGKFGDWDSASNFNNGGFSPGFPASAPPKVPYGGGNTNATFNSKINDGFEGGETPYRQPPPPNVPRGGDDDGFEMPF